MMEILWRQAGQARGQIAGKPRKREGFDEEGDKRRRTLEDDNNNEGGGRQIFRDDGDSGSG